MAAPACGFPGASLRSAQRLFPTAACGAVTFYGNAPQIASNAFKGVTASVFYPSGAEGWNRKTAGQYGGTLTWDTI